MKIFRELPAFMKIYNYCCIEDYIHFIAFTKAVNKNGRVTQNHSGRITKKAMVAIRDRRNIIQYDRVFSVCALIVVLFFFYELAKLALFFKSTSR